MGGETTRVENRGETTRGEMTRGETSWGRNVLLPFHGPLNGNSKYVNLRGHDPYSAERRITFPTS